MYDGMDCFLKLKILCFLFFQPTFTLLSKFMLSHVAQSNVKVY
jgi:hypothetical protein